MNQDNAVAEALERLAALATPGPWEACDRGDYGDFDGDSRVILGDDMRVAVVQTDGRDETEANADLIVELRNNLPTIIAALKARRVDEGGVS